MWDAGPGSRATSREPRFLAGVGNRDIGPRASIFSRGCNGSVTGLLDF